MAILLPSFPPLLTCLSFRKFRPGNTRSILLLVFVPEAKAIGKVLLSRGELLAGKDLWVLLSSAQFILPWGSSDPEHFKFSFLLPPLTLSTNTRFLHSLSWFPFTRQTSPYAYCCDSFENNHSSVDVCWFVFVMRQHEGMKSTSLIFPVNTNTKTQSLPKWAPIPRNPTLYNLINFSGT